MTIKWIDGSPRIYQGNASPTTTESSVNIDAYNAGIMQFFIDRVSGIFYFLKSIDNNNLQTWVEFTYDINFLMSMGFIMNVVPYGNVRAAYADYDPTTSENISSQFFDLSYSLPWWNYSSGKVWNLTAYSSNGDGTFTQTWTQVV